MSTTLEGMSVKITLQLTGSYETPVPVSVTSVTVGSGVELDTYFSARVLSDTDGDGDVEPVQGPNGLLDGRLVVDISGNSVFASFVGQAQPGGFNIKIEGLAPTGAAPGSFQNAGYMNGVNIIYAPTYTVATQTLDLSWYMLGSQPGTTMNQTVFYDNLLEDAPVANDDNFTVSAGQMLSNKNILSNDTDLDNLGTFGIVDLQTVTQIDGVAFTPGEWLQLANGGEIKVSSNGNLEFRDAGEFQHLAQGATQVTTFQYTVTDSAGLSDTAVVSIDVTGVNDAPSATNLTQSKSATEGGPAVALNDIVVSDVDAGDTITATLTLNTPAAGTLSTGTFGSATSTFNAGTGVWAVTGSVADVNAALASVALTPSANNVHNFTITTHIRDAAGTGPADGTISIDVTAVNDAPQVTAPISITVTEDVASALTGISFSDVDAGTSLVTVKLSVPSGSLAATSSANVAVAGSGSETLSLEGIITDINAFIAAGNVAFTTAPDAVADVVLTVTIDDGGNSGTGGSMVSSATVTLDVGAINDAPIVTVPGSIAAIAGIPTALTGISFSDVDAGTGPVTATMSVPNGSLTATSGGNVVIGGTPSALTLTGTVDDINSFIAGSNLAYLTAAGITAAVTLTVDINDNGNTGSGGSTTDTATVSISVEPDAPKLTSVSSSSADGSYKVGDTISVFVTFDQSVTVNTSSGTPALLLETGATDRSASYVSGSGSTTLAFTYTVQAGDVSADLDYHSIGALTLNGGTITGADGDNAVLTLPVPGAAGSLGANKAIIVDGVAPPVPSIELSLDSGQSATDGITREGLIDVVGLEPGASWDYSLDGGATWGVGVGTAFTALAGTYTAGSLMVRTRDAAGNVSIGSSSERVTIDDTAPVLTSAAVDGSSLVLFYSEGLDAINVPAASAFTVTVSGSAVAVSGIAVDASAGTVTLTLASPAGHGEDVTVAYSDPSIADDVTTVQDLAGNDADTLPATPVTNNTAAPGTGPDPQPPEQPNSQAGDLLQGTPGDDVIDGLGGVDVFRIQAKRDDVVITRNADGTITVSHPAFGTDTLSNVELLRFDDQVEIINIPMGQISEPGSASFTEAAYLAQYPDVAAAVASGLFSSGFEHYQLYGAAEGRSLSTLAIDERFYLSQNPDVAAAIERGEFSSAQEHYLLYGINEGRSPNVLFDEAWYLSQNPDVAGAIAGGAVNSAYEHFQMYGWKEGRDPSAWMDLSDYLARNEDVAEAGINPLDHFLNYGIHEDRTIQSDDSGLWLM
ncbi:SwmB domain-containing protein [Pseudorhizobium flavum]|uniref:SwmB domain-containing protein n=1 Tax=Pseudorhizobium flavum TaxID=1335061 RepID=UPI0024907AF7|nr:SwmB domain-containing protein [Pseudorhizobium flavum]